MKNMYVIDKNKIVSGKQIEYCSIELFLRIYSTRPPAVIRLTVHRRPKVARRALKQLLAARLEQFQGSSLLRLKEGFEFRWQGTKFFDLARRAIKQPLAARSE